MFALGLCQASFGGLFSFTTLVLSILNHSRPLNNDGEVSCFVLLHCVALFFCKAKVFHQQHLMSSGISKHLFLPNDANGKFMILSLVLFIANVLETSQACHQMKQFSEMQCREIRRCNQWSHQEIHSFHSHQKFPEKPKYLHFQGSTVSECCAEHLSCKVTLTSPPELFSPSSSCKVHAVIYATCCLFLKEKFLGTLFLTRAKCQQASFREHPYENKTLLSLLQLQMSLTTRHV